MRRSLETLAALLVALIVLGQNADVAARPQSLDDEDYELPNLAGDRSSRDFGGAADEVDMKGVVVTGVEGESGDDAPPASDETHTVVTGDTLWDLSSRYLGSPWYWPKVWSYNPQIENPHWIYPGDQIRLGDGTQREPEPVLASSVDELEHYMEDEVSIAGQIGYQGEGSLQVPALGFLGSREVGSAGKIVKSWEEKALLYEGDRIYVEVRDPRLVRVGETLVIFRSERPVVHPLTGETLGHVTRILGNARWVQAPANGKLATAVITRSVMEITRGDLLGPSGFSNFRQVERTRSTNQVRGVIAGILDDEIHEVAAGHLVFLDKGTEDGVQTGNTMQVVRATDGLADTGFTPPHDEELPAERIGEVVVVEALEASSVGLVTRSARELRRGDRVVMNVARDAR